MIFYCFGNVWQTYPVLWLKIVKQNGYCILLVYHHYLYYHHLHSHHWIELCKRSQHFNFRLITYIAIVLLVTIDTLLHIYSKKKKRDHLGWHYYKNLLRDSVFCLNDRKIDKTRWFNLWKRILFYYFLFIYLLI